MTLCFISTSVGSLSGDSSSPSSDVHMRFPSVTSMPMNHSWVEHMALAGGTASFEHMDLIGGIPSFEPLDLKGGTTSLHPYGLDRGHSLKSFPPSLPSIVSAT